MHLKYLLLSTIRHKNHKIQPLSCVKLFPIILFIFFTNRLKQQKQAWQDNYSSHTNKNCRLFAHMCMSHDTPNVDEQTMTAISVHTRGSAGYFFMIFFFYRFLLTSPRLALLLLIFCFVYKTNWPVKSLQAILPNWKMRMNWAVIFLLSLLFLFQQTHTSLWTVEKFDYSSRMEC